VTYAGSPSRIAGLAARIEDDNSGKPGDQRRR
jgi:hypothetical protein